MPRKTGRTSVLFWAMLCSMLMAIIGFELLHPPQLNEALVAPSHDPVLAETPESALLEQYQIAPLAKYNEIVERPLFLDTRRQPPPDVKPAVVQAPPEEDDTSFTLIGVLVTPEATTALVQVDESGKVVRLKAGETVENWQLESVDADNVTLRKRDKTKTLPLIRNKKRPDPVQNNQAQAQARAQAQAQARERLIKRRQAIINRRQQAQNSGLVGSENATD